MVDGRVRSGKASAEKMTAEQRKERAMKGVEARKERSKLPSAEYEGKLNVFLSRLCGGESILAIGFMLQYFLSRLCGGELRQNQYQTH